MTKEQKIKLAELIEEFGLYPTDSVFRESCYIFRRLQAKSKTPLTLHTDEHKSYLRALRYLNSNFVHRTTNSKERRVPSNPLFAVNHLHMHYRHFFSSQHRETISFQKHEAALMEKMQLMKVYKNFMKPKFVKKSKFDKEAATSSPAMYIKLVDRILEFKEVFGVRRHPTQFELDGKELEFLRRQYPYSRQKIAV